MQIVDASNHEKLADAAESTDVSVASIAPQQRHPSSLPLSSAPTPPKSKSLDSNRLLQRQAWGSYARDVSANRSPNADYSLQQRRLKPHPSSKPTGHETQDIVVPLRLQGEESMPADNPRTAINAPKTQPVPMSGHPSEASSGQTPYSVASTSSLSPQRRDNMSYDGSDTYDGRAYMFEDGIPDHVVETDAFQARKQLVQLRYLLVRCLVLQCTIDDLEHKPWTHEPGHSPYTYYSKIKHLAYKARQLGVALESQGLQARCEYWAGRGCGGTQNWNASIEHFTLAIKLDRQNETLSNGGLRPQGLKPLEKEDVFFLLNHVKKRYGNWLKKTADARDAAQYESRLTGMSVDDCINEDETQNPNWQPSRDLLVDAKRQYSIRVELCNNMEGDAIGLGITLPRYGTDATNLASRPLTRTELHYIRHGDERTKKLEKRFKQGHNVREPKTTGSGLQNSNNPLSSHANTASTNSSKRFTPPVKNLAQELAELGSLASGSPASSSVDWESSPKSNLENHDEGVAQIGTSNIQKRGSLRLASSNSPTQRSDPSGTTTPTEWNGSLKDTIDLLNRNKLDSDASGAETGQRVSP